MFMRLVDGVVADLSVDPSTSFTAGIADEFELVPSGAPADLGPGYHFSNGVWTAPQVAPPSDPVPQSPPPLEQAREQRLAAIDAKLMAILSLGAPVAGGLHVELDNEARTDMDGMATTALAAMTGAVPWPDSYKLGWITAENVRIPLTAPADGLALAAGVGAYYATCRQHARTLKDAALAAADADALAAIDPQAGWPPSQP